MDRANSCQSDSSGFLEEPVEAPLLQVEGVVTTPSLVTKHTPFQPYQPLSQPDSKGRIPSLPSSQSPTENTDRKPRDQSHSSVSSRDCQQESKGSDSKRMVSSSFSSQDWIVLEEKASASVLKEQPPLEATQGPQELLVPDMVFAETATWEHPWEDSHLQQPSPTLEADYEDVGAIVISKFDGPLGFMVTHITEEEEGSLRLEGAREVLMQRHHCEYQRPSGIDQNQDRFPQEASDDPGAESHKLCPDTGNTLLVEERPSEHILRHREVTHNRVDLVQTPDKSTSHPNKLPGEAPRYSSAGCSRSMTTQMSSGLVSAAQSVVASGMDYRRADIECTLCDPITITELRQETETKQVSHVSVQTYTYESEPCHCCISPSDKAFTHRPEPLTQSVSLDTSFPSVDPMGTCPTTLTHCCFCCHHHFHRLGERPCAGPAPCVGRHWLCPHAEHLEAEFTKTLRVLQDTFMRELYSCTVHEVEAMKTICQSFQEHLEEIEQHLMGQQTLICRDMSEDEREEAEQLQTLREALRKQVAELEFQLGHRAQQIRERILLQLELLMGEASEHCTSLHQHSCPEGNNGQTSDASTQPTTTPHPAFPPSGGQQAPSSGSTQMAVLAAPDLETSTELSPLPPAWAESGPACTSHCSAGEKDTNVLL